MHLLAQEPLSTHYSSTPLANGVTYCPATSSPEKNENVSLCQLEQETCSWTIGHSSQNTQTHNKQPLVAELTGKCSWFIGGTELATKKRNSATFATNTFLALLWLDTGVGDMAR